MILWKHQPPTAQATVYLLAGQRQASREAESVCVWGGGGGGFSLQLFFSNDKAPGGCSLREEGFILVQSLRHSQSIVAGQTWDGGGSFPAGRSTGSQVYCSRSRRCAVGRGHSNRFNVYSFNNLPNTSVLKGLIAALWTKNQGTAQSPPHVSCCPTSSVPLAVSLPAVSSWYSP